MAAEPEPEISVVIPTRPASDEIKEEVWTPKTADPTDERVPLHTRLAAAIHRIDTILMEVHEKRKSRRVSKREELNSSLETLKKDLFEMENLVRKILMQLKKEKSAQDEMQIEMRKTMDKIKAYETEVKVLHNIQNEVAMIDKQSFFVMRKTMRPPPALKTLFTAIAMLFCVPKWKMWEKVQSFVANAGTQERIIKLKPEDLDAKTIVRVKKFLDDHPELNRVSAYKSSKTLAPLEPWLRSILALAERIVIQGMTEESVQTHLADVKKKSIFYQKNVSDLALTVARAEAAELQVVGAIKQLIGDWEGKSTKNLGKNAPKGAHTREATDTGTIRAVNFGTTSTIAEGDDEGNGEGDGSGSSTSDSETSPGASGDEMDDAAYAKTMSTFNNATISPNSPGPQLDKSSPKNVMLVASDEQLPDERRGKGLGRTRSRSALQRDKNEDLIHKMAEELVRTASDIDVRHTLERSDSWANPMSGEFEDIITRYNNHKRLSFNYSTEAFGIWQKMGATFMKPKNKQKKKKRKKKKKVLARSDSKKNIGYRKIDKQSSSAAPWLEKVETMRKRNKAKKEEEKSKGDGLKTIAKADV